MASFWGQPADAFVKILSIPAVFKSEKTNTIYLKKYRFKNITLWCWHLDSLIEEHSEAGGSFRVLPGVNAVRCKIGPDAKHQSQSYG